MLQEAWFLLIGVLLVGYAILDGFDLAEQWLGRPMVFEDAPSIVADTEHSNLVVV